MKFTIIGSGTLVPDADRGSAGFLVEEGAARVLVDGGSGTMTRLKKIGVDVRELDGGVYSHRHVDHCGDLVPILFALKVGVELPRLRDYPIWAGEGFQGFLDGLYGVYGAWIRSERWTTTVTELPLDGAGTALLPGGVRLDTLPANHSAGALHLRFTSPSGFVALFSGDTGPSDNLVKLAQNVDVLITECAVPGKDPWDSHLGPDDVAAIVDAAKPRRVIMTHLYPDNDPATALARVASTGVRVERGYDGLMVEG